MADTKLADLTSGTAASTDIIYAVKDPAGTPLDRKIALSSVKDLIVGSGSVSVASGKTLTANNSLTFAGTDSTTMTFPSTSATLARTDAAQTFTGAQTITGGTLNDTVLDISQTWSGTGTYTGLRYNVTDSGPSTASSLLMDLQVGGASRFVFRKDGLAAIRTGLNVGSSDIRLFNTDAAALAFGGTGRKIIIGQSTGGIIFSGDQTIQFGSSTGSSDVIGSADLFLSRRGAANLRLGAADAASPVAQTLSVQSVVAGTSNTAGANLTITGSQGTGTGAGGSIIFQVAPAGSSGTAQNALSEALRINSAGLVSFAGTTSSFPALKRSSATLQVRLADDSADAGLQCAALTVTGNLTISTKDIVTDTTTGTKIGTGTTQKLGFYNATPVVQPTAVADATDAATVITQLNALLSRMRNLGLIAT